MASILPFSGRGPGQTLHVMSSEVMQATQAFSCSFEVERSCHQASCWPDGMRHGPFQKLRIFVNIPDKHSICLPLTYVPWDNTCRVG